MKDTMEVTRKALVEQVEGLKKKVEEDERAYGDWYGHYMHAQALLTNFDGQKPLEWNDYTYLLYLLNNSWQKVYEWATIPTSRHLDELSCLTPRGIELLMVHGIKGEDIQWMKRNERTKILQVQMRSGRHYNLPIK